MKNLVITLLLAITFQPLFGQDIFKNPDVGVVNIGIDFSRTTFVDRAGFTSPRDVHDRYLEGWNMLLWNESDKYDFKSALGLTKYEFNVDPMVEYSMANADYKEFVKSSKPDAWSEEDIAAMVKKYPSVTQDQPIAMVWIPEYFSKPDENAKVHLVFFKTDTREVVTHKTFDGKPGGFGLRNYWAGAFGQILKQVKKGYKTWSK